MHQSAQSGQDKSQLTIEITARGFSFQKPRRARYQALTKVPAGTPTMGSNAKTFTAFSPRLPP